MPTTNQARRTEGRFTRATVRIAARAVVSLLFVAGLFVVPAPLMSDHFVECAEAQGQIRVTVVVDPGTVGGAPRGPESTCVTVSSGATGADVLAERARKLGRPQPRYDSSGLLCALDGYPSSGCGEQGSGGYEYWAYSTSRTGDWRHSSQGPAFRRMQDGDVEGWRFLRGAGNPSDPPPRLAPSSACPSGSSPSPGGSGSSQSSSGGSAGSGSSSSGQGTSPTPTAPPTHAPVPTAPPPSQEPVGPATSRPTGGEGDASVSEEASGDDERSGFSPASAGASGQGDDHPTDGRGGDGRPRSQNSVEGSGHPTDGRFDGEDLESAELAVATDDGGTAGAAAVAVAFAVALVLGGSAAWKARRRSPA